MCAIWAKLSKSDILGLKKTDQPFRQLGKVCCGLDTGVSCWSSLRLFLLASQFMLAAPAGLEGSWKLEVGSWIRINQVIVVSSCGGRKTGHFKIWRWADSKWSKRIGKQFYGWWDREVDTKDPNFLPMSVLFRRAVSLCPVPTVTAYVLPTNKYMQGKQGVEMPICNAGCIIWVK